MLRDKRQPIYGVEEGISIRAIKREYARLSGDTRRLTPKEIFEIAEGNLEGNPAAAREAFDHAGEVLGEAIASMNAVVDGIVVIGGGIIAAHKYLMPAVMRELNGTLTETVEYDPMKRMGVITTKLGTSRAIAFGAYAFALNELDK